VQQKTFGKQTLKIRYLKGGGEMGNGLVRTAQVRVREHKHGKGETRRTV